MSKQPTSPTPDDGILAAEYALGLLRGKARDDFSRRMASEPALARHVRQWDEQFVQFAEDMQSVEAPAHIQAALEERLFQRNEKPSLWSSLNFWRGLAVASLAAALTLGAWNLRPTSQSPQVLVAQVAGDAKAVALLAHYDKATGELRLNRTLGTAASNRSFELWLIAGNAAPVSLGLLAPEQQQKIVVPQVLRDKLTGGVLAISDEPAGGSPTGAPTGAVLATGPLTAV